jgi:hypothetical protein
LHHRYVSWREPVNVEPLEAQVLQNAVATFRVVATVVALLPGLRAVRYFTC